MGTRGDRTGEGPHYPRETVVALARRMANGAGPTTVNHYLRAVRGFFRWLVKARRFASNPLDSLELVNASVDVRRGRRELKEGELRAMLSAARTSNKSFRGLSSEERYHLYLVASTTGFRAGAFAALNPADFHLSDETPSVVLAARFNKSRKPKRQPLSMDVAAALALYLHGKPSGSPVCGGTWAADRRGAEMLRTDLAPAGVAYAVEGPDGQLFADFHSLRHSFLTMLGWNGVDLRTVQILAGHSKPELTARYSHRNHGRPIRRGRTIAQPINPAPRPA